jgi:hypothetical protein
LSFYLTFVCVARDKSKTFFADACLPLWGKRASKQEIERVALCLLFCIFLSTKGAYYGANKQA